MNSRTAWWFFGGICMVMALGLSLIVALAADMGLQLGVLSRVTIWGLVGWSAFWGIRSMDRGPWIPVSHALRVAEFVISGAAASYPALVVLVHDNVFMYRNTAVWAMAVLAIVIFVVGMHLFIECFKRAEKMDSLERIKRRSEPGAR